MEVDPEQLSGEIYSFVEFYANITGNSTITCEKNGRIAAVLFMFKNPFFDEPTDMTIWNPPTTEDDTNGENDGSFQFCVRVGYKREIGGSIQLISFLDTKITVNVNFVGNFNSFTQNVPINIEQATLNS